jgi:hypothetical protein
MTGCSFCRKHFGTVEQFKFYITHDVASAAAGERHRVKTKRVRTAGYLEISLKPLRTMLPKRMKGSYGQH